MGEKNERKNINKLSMIYITLVWMIMSQVASGHYSNLEYIFYNENKKVNLIFVHGAFGLAESLFPIAKDFRIKKVANSYLISLRNHGNSSDDLNKPLKGSLEDIKNLILNQNLKNVYLIGFSLGGRVVMEFAARYPQLIKGIGILDMSPFIFSTETLNGFESSLQALLAVNLHQTQSALKADLFSIFNDNIFVDYLWNAIEGTDNNYSWTVNLYGLREWNKIYLKAIPAKFYKKAIFVIGGQSNIFAPGQIDQLNAFFPNLNKQTDVLVVNSGHFVFIQQFDQTVNHLLKLIE